MGLVRSPFQLSLLSILQLPLFNFRLLPSIMVTVSPPPIDLARLDSNLVDFFLYFGHRPPLVLAHVSFVTGWIAFAFSPSRPASSWM